jgi:hypothetical protein
MMRSLNVSTEVFAAIWAKRQDGEETEDAILRRVLGCSRVASGASTVSKSSPTGGGVHDIRNGVDFPEGFEILRSYKRRNYVAIAKGGYWVRADNGERYPTLNQLNGSIAAGAENVWNGNWKYKAADGSIRSISDLRR